MGGPGLGDDLALVDRQARQTLARSLRLGFPEGFPKRLQTGVPQGAPDERRRPGHQLIEQHAQAVEVASRVDVEPAHVGLLGTHVGRCPDERMKSSARRGLLTETSLERLGDPEVDDPRDRCPVFVDHQQVGRLDVAMQHALLMRMLHRTANPDRQFEACGHAQAVAVAVVGDGLAGDQFHHHVRPASFSRAGVEDLGNAGMIHHGHGLPFALEAGDHIAAVHARLQDLDGHATPDRIGLLGREDPSHPALT